MLTTAGNLPRQRQPHRLTTGLNADHDDFAFALGFDPACFQTSPPACYRATGSYPDRTCTGRRRRAMNTKIHHGTTPRCHLLLCWTHEWSGLGKGSARQR
jgi:hypothetical protein